MTQKRSALTGGPGCNPCSPVPVGAPGADYEPCPRPELIELEPPLGSQARASLPRTRDS